MILDEAVSALDATVRLRMLEMIARVQRETGVACLFVSHDLAATRAIAHRIAVIDAGRIVECAPTERLIAQPATELARRLIAAVPALHPLAPNGRADAPEMPLRPSSK